MDVILAVLFTTGICAGVIFVSACVLSSRIDHQGRHRHAKSYQPPRIRSSAHKSSF